MRRWLIFFLALVLTACFPWIGIGYPPCACSPGLDEHPIKVKLSNHGIASLNVANGYFVSKTLHTGEATSGELFMLMPSKSGAPAGPPAPNEVATNHVLLYKLGDPVKSGRLLFGGPLALYEKTVAREPDSDFAQTTLHAHSLFFVPGSQVREHLGLLVNNPVGTETFTSLDPWKPYKFEGFTLNIDVYDLDAGDIRMSVTGTLAN